MIYISTDNQTQTKSKIKEISVMLEGVESNKSFLCLIRMLERKSSFPIPFNFI